MEGFSPEKQTMSDVFFTIENVQPVWEEFEKEEYKLHYSMWMALETLEKTKKLGANRYDDQ